MTLERYARFFIVDEDYPRLVHFVDDDDDDNGDTLLFVDAGTPLQALIDAADRFNKENGKQ